ncbi:hypothetical protein TGAM01_v202865 [Trichoderma gamsii]|uniref:Nudix hydrolase domain-containing protein n=1 Tax=Trichoderma gamsii TaxID=398673 RepID=A0A0W7VYY9_9HYPO|nr:hypothetical protein TGAM01_v202865 [Trichoderma gamsii]PNP43473.1 hypothetical protein TGAMA5MH_04931 [Trichoderma gamsii]PON28371.1 hypothetical protein TGAM01_v202865 [Trichoderma gamsii]
MSSLKDPKVTDDLVKALTASIVNNYPRDVQLAVAKAIPDARPNVRVGVSVLIQNEKGEFLVGERMGSHGAGTVQTPGGHIDFGEEDLKLVAAREVKEETGLDVKFGKFLTVTNDLFKDEFKHYITNWVICIMVEPNAKPEVLETKKCKWWAWMSSEELVKMDKAAEARKAEKKAKGEELDPPAGDELFLPLANLFKQTVDAEASDLPRFMVSTEGLKHV